MPVEITPVQNKKDLHRFVTFPWGLYAKDPNWIPPLIGDTKKLFAPRTNPFFEHGDIKPFLAWRDGVVVGRIAAIRNHAYEDFHQESIGFFGFFECENNPATATALLDETRRYLRREGLATLMGPVSPSTNEDCGVLVDGFDTPPMVMMTHNLPYYDSILTESGLKKAKDLLAFAITSRELPERVVRGAALARRRNPGVVVRPLDMKRFPDEVRAFKKVYNGAWEKNWGFVPMTDAELDHMAKQLKPIIDPGLVRIVEDKGEPVGVALALPDINFALKHANGRLFPFGFLKMYWHSRRIPRARAVALGILEPYRRTGIDVFLYHDLVEYGLKKGYRFGECSWVLEDNLPMIRAMENMGGWAYKTYRLYEAPVSV